MLKLALERERQREREHLLRGKMLNFSHPGLFFILVQLMAECDGLVSGSILVNFRRAREFQISLLMMLVH